jgi:hypothetical protein
MPIKYPERYIELQEEVKTHRDQIYKAQAEMKEIKLKAFAEAKWVKCCRCFPGCVADDGFCGCCEYNHVTKQYLDCGEDL